MSEVLHKTATYPFRESSVIPTPPCQLRWDFNKVSQEQPHPQTVGWRVERWTQQFHRACSVRCGHVGGRRSHLHPTP
ncbi:hypothetical protein HaLaN_14881 [Haematococcus lacustris]|uniref:Uncharacterized protein n=1 Tax=Haematococcus lacustris TaxID=44745 RepID=A0A699Z6E0_HAELA|nr:hypothetical protein HaLaN_14881 [Haematococcus lacustris]